jgi:hypothetical protein
MCAHAVNLGHITDLSTKEKREALRLWHSTEAKRIPPRKLTDDFSDGQDTRISNKKRSSSKKLKQHKKRASEKSTSKKVLKLNFDSTQ